MSFGLIIALLLLTQLFEPNENLQVKTDDLEHQTSINVNYVDFSHRDKKDILEDVSKNVNVILDNSKPSELYDYMKKELGECRVIEHCQEQHRLHLEILCIEHITSGNANPKLQQIICMTSK